MFRWLTVALGIIVVAFNDFPLSNAKFIGLLILFILAIYFAIAADTNIYKSISHFGIWYATYVKGLDKSK